MKTVIGYTERSLRALCTISTALLRRSGQFLPGAFGEEAFFI